MFVSEDGYITGSVDWSRFDEIEPKSDEAKAQHATLKAERDAGLRQAESDAQRASQGERAVGVNSTGRDDGDVKQQAEQRTTQPQPAGGEDKSGQDQSDETKQLQTEAEAAGVTVDKRWGPDRLRQEIDKANAAKAAQTRNR